ncbi:MULTISPECIES: hypothetical protein [unclassified Rhodanobacter]|uniref:hypothetical protein n=1 Tax=unclassified Rhodanobacter TaxID=2621553 RepID=UPI0007AA1997|nr:hypothetical protein [Rhodanobacter sp. FW510-R10]KZC32596.1 hypothetical protein RhoFW510R10_11820 [Rhodanobacter sp. FW510-R10]
MSRNNHLRAKPADHPFEVRLPVPNPAESYALAMTTAHLAHAAHLGEILSSLDVDKDLTRRLALEIDSLVQQADLQWRTFLARSCVTVAEYDAMDAMGPPQTIAIDENGLPVAIWESVTPREPADWPPGLTLAVARHETTFIPTVPFRQVNLASLPPGVAVVRITDPRHAAMSALDEVFRVLWHDVDVHMRDALPAIAWRRLAHLAAFYTKAAKLSGEGLGDDEFREWDRRLREDTPVDQMARVIAEGALTSRAQHVAALQLVARFIGRTMDEHQQAAFEGDETDWMASTLITLDRARSNVDVAMQGYNLALMAFAGVASERASAMAITRPVPHGLPVLAIVPEGASVATIAASRALPSPDASSAAPLSHTRAGVPAPSRGGERSRRRPHKG